MMMLSDVCLSDVCLMSDVSVAYIGPKSRTERPRKTKIGTEVAHVTRDSDTTFKVKRSKVNLQGRGHIVAASRTACFLDCAQIKSARYVGCSVRPGCSGQVVVACLFSPTGNAYVTTV